MKCRRCKAEEKNIWAGQGFTQYKCEHCGQLGWHCNTYIPKICYTCSEENFLCEQCGADIIRKTLEELKGVDKSFYALSLEIGVSEGSLRTYMNSGKAGYKVLDKIKKFVKEELRKDEQRLDG